MEFRNKLRKVILYMITFKSAFNISEGESMNGIGIIGYLVRKKLKDASLSPIMNEY